MRRTSRPASTAKPPVQRKTSTMPPTATQRISTEALSHVLAVATMPRHARLRTAPGSAEADVPSTTASIAMPPMYPVKSERITSPVANASATARIIGRRLIAPRLAPSAAGESAPGMEPDAKPRQTMAMTAASISSQHDNSFVFTPSSPSLP